MKLIKTGAVFLLLAALLMTGMSAAFAASPSTVQTLKPTRQHKNWHVLDCTGRDQKW